MRLQLIIICTSGGTGTDPDRKVESVSPVDKWGRRPTETISQRQARLERGREGIVKNQLKIYDRKNQDQEILRLGCANVDQKNPNPESAQGRNGIGSL